MAHMEVDAERLMALALRAAEERQTEPEAWWYLSFATKEAFIGGIIARGRGPVTARMRVAELGLAPRGEMLAMPVERDGVAFDASYVDRLLSVDELQAAFAPSGGVGRADLGGRK
jgi:hypothetical protein